MLYFFYGLLTVLLLVGCSDQPWNNPYPSKDAKANYYYSSFSEQPKTLDPARSYTVEEALFTAQIYEPPLQYQYFKRPYQLVPLAATQMPQIIFLDSQGHELPANTPWKNIAYSLYKIQIKPGIYYQPHPAFACKLYNANGQCTQYLYHDLNPEEITNKYNLTDFPKTGTRELTAEDYVYQIKRLASPKVQSPIFGLLSNYIVGLTELNNSLKTQKNWQDLRAYPLSGVIATDKYNYVIKIKGYYPQFIFWLTMPFFSPMPWEAEVFYNQIGMKNHNLTLDWYPIGTGPYQLTENNPNQQMILARNPNFHGESFPVEINNTKFRSLLGKPLPFIDKFIFTLEKENIPRWNKFLQGYYDQSAISSDSFDQAVSVDTQGKPIVTPLLKDKGIRLQTSVSPAIFFVGFNMLDPTVGGTGDRARKLRQAISIAFDTEEYIAIFLNGRGIPAQGPLPPGIFGYRAGLDGINPVVYQITNGRIIRRSLEAAKKLLAEAGYPNGQDPVTHRALLLNFDVVSGGTGDDRSYFAWLREKFNTIGLDLQIRDTPYNRFQDKVRRGQAQIFSWGWNADYPDPENFLFLLYGPNGKVKFDGENAANYQNTEFDQLFLLMRNLPNGPERQAVIDKMVQIVRNDAPWIWDFYPQTFMLSQPWVGPLMPSEIINNTLKYWQINPVLREKLRRQWN